MIDSEAAIHPVLPLTRRALRTILELVSAMSGLQGMSVELRITSDRAITELHRRHMGGVGPTNVLSFPPEDSNHARQGGRGSIVISADAVLREAFLYQQKPQDHFIRLLTHALLHLAGYEHGAIMEELTENIVQRMGMKHSDSQRP